MQSFHRASWQSRSSRSTRRVTRLSAFCVGLLFSGVVGAEPERAQAAGAGAQPPSEAAEVDTEPGKERVILLVRTSADDEVMGRLRAELADSDWRIVELRVDDRLGRSPLRELARKEAVSAAVRLDSARGVIELWIARPSGEMEETIGNPDERSSSSVLALGTTEALRARGLSRDAQEAEALEEPAPKVMKEVERPSSPSFRPMTPVLQNFRATPAAPRRLWLEFAPAAAASPGGLRPAFQALIGARLEIRPRWALAVFGLLPLATQEVSAVEGTAHLSTFLLAGVSEVSWLRASIVELSSGIGLGATISAMRGVPGPGFRAEDVTVAVPTAFARSSLQVRLAEMLHLSARILAGATLPRVSVRFEDREVATWGLPLFVATLGVEVPLLDMSP